MSATKKTKGDTKTTPETGVDSTQVTDAGDASAPLENGGGDGIESPASQNEKSCGACQHYQMGPPGGFGTCHREEPEFPTGHIGFCPHWEAQSGDRVVGRALVGEGLTITGETLITEEGYVVPGPSHKAHGIAALAAPLKITVKRQADPSLEVITELLALMEEGFLLQTRLSGHACISEVQMWTEHASLLRKRIHSLKGTQVCPGGNA